MSEPTLVEINHPLEVTADVVFIHGLEGDGRGTWESSDTPGFFFPALVAKAHETTQVWTLDYPIHAFNYTKEPTLPLGECARAVLALLNEKGIGKRPTIAICHSYGGLLVQQLIRHAEGIGHPLCKSLCGLALFGTPHRGSTSANWLKRFTFGLFGAVCSPVIDELTTNSPIAAELRGWMEKWVATSQIKIVVFNETGRFLTITDCDSAIGAFRNAERIPLYGNHTDICKPSRNDDLPVLRVNRLISECISAIAKADEPSPDFGQEVIYSSQVRVMAFLSGELPYTIGVSAALSTQLRKLGSKCGIDFQYYPVEGPSDQFNQQTKARWTRLVKSELRAFGQPDCYVTIGTPASEVLRDFLSEEYGQTPFIFLAVADPVKAGLVRELENRIDDRQIAGVAYWNDASVIVTRLAQIIPDRKLIFTYQKGFAADKYLAGRIEGTNHWLDVSVKMLERLPCCTMLRDRTAVYCSGYTFERFFHKYASDEKAQRLLDERLIVMNSPDLVDRFHGAIAAVGCDDDDLGYRGAQLIVDHFMKKGPKLGAIEIKAPPVVHWINSRTAKRKKITLSKFALENAKADFAAARIQEAHPIQALANSTPSA